MKFVSIPQLVPFFFSSLSSLPLPRGCRRGALSHSRTGPLPFSVLESSNFMSEFLGYVREDLSRNRFLMRDLILNHPDAAALEPEERNAANNLLGNELDEYIFGNDWRMDMINDSHEDDNDEEDEEDDDEDDEEDDKDDDIEYDELGAGSVSQERGPDGEDYFRDR